MIRIKLRNIFSGFGKAGSMGAIVLALSTGMPAHASETDNTNVQAPQEHSLNLKMTGELNQGLGRAYQSDENLTTQRLVSQEIDSGIPLQLSSTLRKNTESILKMPNVIQKKVPAKHFEQALMNLIGTPYKSGVSDCSGIIRMALKNLEVIRKTDIIGSASTIIKTLTTDKRNPLEARPGDFFYWIPHKDPSSRHIAYVSAVETKGVWLIDSSTDHNGTTKRFFPWDEVKKKQGIVGTASFLKM